MNILNHSLVALVLELGSLVCWKVAVQSNLKSFGASNNFYSKIFLYLAPSIFPSILNCFFVAARMESYWRGCVQGDVRCSITSLLCSVKKIYILFSCLQSTFFLFCLLCPLPCGTLWTRPPWLSFKEFGRTWSISLYCKVLGSTTAVLQIFQHELWIFAGISELLWSSWMLF